jgi:uncharacterized YigZ family protein
MSVFTYTTIQQPTTGVYKEKGSKFLGFAYPVNSETEIKQKIEQLKKEYFDARHHCFAWMLGPEKKHFRAFDDGEPNHSAGDPILGQIRSKGVTNVLVVVVRYFGGVKLGVGGLIGAYKAATEDALAKATFIEKNVTEEVILSFDYLLTADVMRMIKELDLKIIEQKFDEGCSIQLNIPSQQKENLLSRLSLMKAMGKAIKWTFSENNNL